MDSVRMAVAGILRDHKVEALGRRMGVSASCLYKWSEPDTEANPHGDIPLWRAVQLSLITGDCRVMEALAEECGGSFIPGKSAGAAFTDMGAALGVMKEAAGLLEKYAAAVEDGRVTVEELRALVRAQGRLALAAACIIQIGRAHV